MNADTRTVDHDDLTVECLGNRRQQPIPNAGFAPSNKPVVAGGVGSVALRHVGPRRSSPEAPEDAVDNLAVIDTRHSANLVRKMRLNDAPLEIAQFVTPHQSLQKKP